MLWDFRVVCLNPPGLLLTHFAIRQLMVEASRRTACDPDTLSFVHTIEIVRRNLPFYVAFSP